MTAWESGDGGSNEKKKKRRMKERKKQNKLNEPKAKTKTKVERIWKKERYRKVVEEINNSFDRYGAIGTLR